jgi:hypothetical protein
MPLSPLPETTSDFFSSKSLSMYTTQIRVEAHSAPDFGFICVESIRLKDWTNSAAHSVLLVHAASADARK